MSFRYTVAFGIGASLVLLGCSSGVPVPTHDQVCKTDAVARQLHAAMKPAGGR